MLKSHLFLLERSDVLVACSHLSNLFESVNCGTFLLQAFVLILLDHSHRPSDMLKHSEDRAKEI